MTNSKSKSSKSTGDRKRVSQPVPVSIPTLPIPDFDESAFALASSQLEMRAREASKRLTSLLQALDETKARGPLEALAKGERLSVLPELLTELSADTTNCLSEIGRLQSLITAWRASERRSRRVRFEEIARSLQWKLNGAWPESVINGIVFATVDDLKDRGTVNGRVLTGSLTAERLAAAVAADLTLLQQNLTEPSAFIAMVWNAFAALAVAPGNGVDVHDLLAELTWQRQSKTFQKDPRTELYRGYPLAQFRADLTNYLANGAPAHAVKGRSYELQIVGGSFAQEGVFMYFPQTDRLATCGRLTFQPIDREPSK